MLVANHLEEIGVDLTNQFIQKIKSVVLIAKLKSEY